MSSFLQSILVPVVDEVPRSAIAYAECLSKAYSKPVSLLFFSLELFKSNDYVHNAALTSDDLYDGVNEAVVSQDCVMVVWQIPQRKKALQAFLNAARNWRIPYFFIPENLVEISINKVYMPLSYLIEDREKGVWAKSLNRVFNVEFILLKPNDKGSRATKNCEYVSSFMGKNDISHAIVDSKRPSFKIDAELVAKVHNPADLIILTASREYGLDDLIFGPRERKNIRKSRVPLMLLNPRGDLYVLCGD